MPKVVKEYRDIAELRNELLQLGESVDKAEDSCRVLLENKTTYSHLRYVQEQFVSRAVNFFSNTAERLIEEVLANQIGNVQISDDETDIEEFFPLADARRCVLSCLEDQFSKCPVYKILRGNIRERIEVSGGSIVFELEDCIYPLTVNKLEEIPVDHPLREFLVVGCGFDLGYVEPTTTTTVTPEPAIAIARAVSKLAKSDEQDSNSRRIQNWPSNFRTDLSSHPTRYRFVPESKAGQEIEETAKRFEHYMKHVRQFDGKHFRSRVPSGKQPILIEELPFVSSETVRACNDAGRFTIPELITIDKPVKLLKEIKRLGHQRLFELQCGLAELGADRLERDIMAFEKPSESVSLRVRDLGVSILHKLRFEFRWLHAQVYDVNRPLHDAVFPNYEIKLGRHDVASPDHWVISLPRVTPSSFELVFGGFGKSGTEIEALDTFQKMSYTELDGIMLEQFDSEGLDDDERLEEILKRRVCMMEIIESYAAFKAIYAQDKNGYSWYDNKFGHMPWIIRNKEDLEFDPKAKIQKDADYTSTFIGKTTDFTTAKDLRGVRGVPLSAYGKVKKREHPAWWKTDQS